MKAFIVMSKIPRLWITVLIVIACSPCQRASAISLNATWIEVENTKLIHTITSLRDALYQVSTPNITITVADGTPKCIQMECKFICFNGIVDHLVKDIELVMSSTKINCTILDELKLYSYEFPNNQIHIGFLGTLHERVASLYIGSSNIQVIEDGAFANGMFRELAFENLQLGSLEQTFLSNMSHDFSALSIIQKRNPITTIDNKFLEPVKYRIKSLVLQVGVWCVRNLTASDNLLNTLTHVDFSHNNFGDRLHTDTFSKLSVVQRLLLAHSQITSLPPNIFAELLSTLDSLDLSHNQLTTISYNIFGWRGMPTDLIITAEHNPWYCTCELLRELQDIFAHQLVSLSCAAPPEYDGWSVFDERICGIEAPTTSQTTSSSPTRTRTTQSTSTKSTIPMSTGTGITASQTSRPTTTSIQTTTKKTSTTNTSSTKIPISTSTIGPTECQSCSVPTKVQLKCRAGSKVRIQHVTPPPLRFQVARHPCDMRSVLITINSQSLKPSQGLIWFSSVTKAYYNMEVNYRDYGLGCFNSLNVETSVAGLVPDVAYTFCLVEAEQLGVSPFSCQSFHVSGNVAINYGAWLTRDMQFTGISLIIFGIVMFVFSGILSVFLVIKQKPTLLKGSKRIAQTKSGRHGEIVVFPKDKTFEDFKHKEELIAKRSSKSSINYQQRQRRDSTASADSNQSYMNANLYEVIPVYERLNGLSPDSAVPPDSSSNRNAAEFHEQSDDASETYSTIMPLGSPISSSNVVRYAQIPHRSKRISNDPLPELPHESPSSSGGTVSSCLVGRSPGRMQYFMTLDSHV